MSSTSYIVELATIITDNTRIVDEYLKSKKLPTLSFDVDTPATIPIPPHEVDVLAAQDKVISTTQELHNLIKGPTEMLMGIAAISPNNSLSLQAVYHYQIYSAFPLEEEASFESISAMCGLNEIDLRRLLRHAMSNHIFQERNGKVAHTAASKLLAQSANMRNIIGIMTEEMFLGAAHTVEALDKYGKARAPNECGYSLGQNTDKNLYGYLSQLPDRARRFAGAMSGFAARTTADPLIEAFDWSSAQLCVDVGGGWGPVAAAMAERFPNLRMIVEDLPHVIADGPSHIPVKLHERVTFKPRDILKDADHIIGADVYVLRHVLHNFPDRTCVQILCNQIKSLQSRPANGAQAHLLILDGVIPEPRVNLTPHKERFRRSMDLIMLTFFGARERNLSDWKEIVKQADPGLHMSYSGYPSNILDVVWQGEGTNDIKEQDVQQSIS